MYHLLRNFSHQQEHQQLGWRLAYLCSGVRWHKSGSWHKLVPWISRAISLVSPELVPFPSHLYSRSGLIVIASTRSVFSLVEAVLVWTTISILYESSESSSSSTPRSSMLRKEENTRQQILIRVNAEAMTEASPTLLPIRHLLFILTGSSMLLASRTASALLRSRGAIAFSHIHSSTKSNTNTSTSRAMSSVTTSFQAWRVEEESEGHFQGIEQTLSIDALPFGDTPDSILIKVSHSSLNYKDALSASGNRGVTRKFPHTPGIDAAGTSVEGGEAVMVTGYDLGMNTDGGFGEYIRVPKDWVVSPMPFPDAKTAMVYGTAGLTAGLCVQKLLKNGATPAQGRVVVTGSTGSVGSVAVELLAKLGFEVVAITGKVSSQQERLLDLGAKEVLGREALEATKKPMVRPAFANAIDTVGGSPLAELLKQIQPGGSVACCGLVAGPKLETTVLPFILRGVNLLGVDSVEIPLSEKKAVWEKLASSWACPKAEALAVEIGRHELNNRLEAFLKGESTEKLVLNHSLSKSNL